MYSHSPFWWRNIGSAFIRMKSSTSMPSILTGRRTRTCLPFTKMVMNSCRRFLRARFCAGVSFRLGFPIRRHSNLITMPTCIYQSTRDSLPKCSPPQPKPLLANATTAPQKYKNIVCHNFPITVLANKARSRPADNPFFSARAEDKRSPPRTGRRQLVAATMPRNLTCGGRQSAATPKKFSYLRDILLKVGSENKTT